IQALLAEGHRVSFVGSRSGLEAQLLGDLPIAYHGIAAGKLRRYLSFENFLDAFKVLFGILEALVLLKRLKADVVFSKGGFVSFPLVLAAGLWRIPVVAHESDLTPGLANRLALPFVHSLCVNFPDTKPARFAGRLICTGTPVRQALLNGSPERGRALLGVDAGRRILLVTGGSLGADRLNAVVRAALPQLLPEADVVLVCGPGKLSGIERTGFHEFEFVSDAWGDLLACADLVVSRAGANTLYELLCLGKPNILVPLSRKASRGDQIENAAYARRQGFSRVLQEEDLAPQPLVALVIDALEETHSGRMAGFQPPDSVRLICEAITEAVKAA
ncbi:MAG: UDP-N-acetylglucosamine--N-acetylmuramyl-(pentapeptide) pyrophosphoryl-undecaprenol N-acetylglucosamine transferase, partial [Pseudomonadales bacterium]|nr:UDP-N-acetylglucosamine--N-acetylmuramyl-(pentapeptide) pyrophosphoryl-undecaprenol N-acetylglucosamine transferase [Pseudomonadales bacterium]